MQTTLSLLALLLVMLLSVQSFHIVNRTERQIVLNEISTQLTGVGVEVIERVGSTLYDANTAGGIVISSIDSLTSTSDFGPGMTSCEYDPASANSCAAVEQFDGLTLSVDRDGITYDVSIGVSYFDESSNIVTSNKKFAKQVQVSISNPNLYISEPDNPMVVTMARIVTYSPF